MSSGYNDDDDRDDRWEDKAARARVKTPAIIMLVLACLSLAMLPIGVINYFLLPAQFEAQRKQMDQNPNMQPAQKQQMKDFLNTYENIIMGVLPFTMPIQGIVSLLCVFGSLKMKNLTSRGWAIATSVLNYIVWPGMLLSVDPSRDLGPCRFAESRRYGRVRGRCPRAIPGAKPLAADGPRLR